jgi:predicted acylesterase/phospholipase RssA
LHKIIIFKEALLVAYVQKPKLMLPLSTPFNSIALSLSGGGYRAASFSIGIMSYLDRIGLLKNVEFISSASGGTFAASLYGVYYSKGRPFYDCYKFLLEKMQGEELLNRVLEVLNDDTEWKPVGVGKRRNLINAFAKVYDEKLFLGEQFDIFWNQKPDKHLEVCFNSTEFHHGLSFRFQTDGNSKTAEFIGNRNIHFNDDKFDFRKMKVADILAASSCFPAGFEPIVFPDDFTHVSLTKNDLKDAIILEAYDESREPLNKPVGFMDGGITDNQGLYSALTADQRRRDKNMPFDLVIVGDVTSHFMDPYKVVEQETETGWRAGTLNGFLKKAAGIFRKIKKGMIASVFVSLLSLIFAIANIFTFGILYLTSICLFLFGASLVTSVFLFFITRAANKQKLLKKLFAGDVTPEIKTILEQLNVGNNFSPAIIDKLTSYLGNTKLNVIEQMLKSRAASVLTMTMDVNLKHTRRLIYELFYKNQQFDNRRLYNVLFELSTFNCPNRVYRINNKLPWAKPEDKQLLHDVPVTLRTIAEDAWTMGTTLWFAKDDVMQDKLKKLVTTGQFTTCINLIEYVLLIERKVEKSELNLVVEELNKVKIMKEQLLKDWNEFKKDPYHLYNSLA